jgi:hypothetical protein
MCAKGEQMNIGPSEWEYIKNELIKPYMNEIQTYSRFTRKDIGKLRSDFRIHLNQNNAQEKRFIELSSIIKRSLIPALNRVTKFVKDCRAGEAGRIKQATGAIKKTPVWQALILYLAVISGLTGGVLVITREIYGFEQVKAQLKEQKEINIKQDAIIQAIPKGPSQ